MTGQAELGTTLASAEAALARAIVGSADAGASWSKTNLKLDYVRVYCRQLRAALADLGGSRSTANIDKARATCRELRVAFLELNPAATIPFRCDEASCSVLRSPPTTCWLDHLERLIAASRQLGARVDGQSAAPDPAPAKAPARSGAGSVALNPWPDAARTAASPLRQGIDLLALVLAYLFYYFADVQLQIATLPSNISMPLQ